MKLRSLAILIGVIFLAGTALAVAIARDSFSATDEPASPDHVGVASFYTTTGESRSTDTLHRPYSLGGNQRYRGVTTGVTPNNPRQVATMVADIGDGLNCDAIEIQRPPRTPSFALPGRRYTLFLTIGEYHAQGLDTLNVLVNSDHSYLGDAVLASLSGVASQENSPTAGHSWTLHRPPIDRQNTFALTWTVSPTAPYGTNVELELDVAVSNLFASVYDALQRGLQPPTLTCTLRAEVTIRPPAATFMEAPPRIDMLANVNTPSPGDIVLLAATISNSGNRTILSDTTALTFTQSIPDGVVRVPGSGRILAYDRTNRLLPHRQERLVSTDFDNGHSIQISDIVPGGAIVISFMARVGEQVQPGSQLALKACLNDNQECSDETVFAITQRTEPVGVHLLVNDALIHARGPYIVHIAVSNDSDEDLVNSRLYATLPFAVTYIEESGSLQHVSQVATGQVAFRTGESWIEHGLRLPRIPSGDIAHIMFAAERADTESLYYARSIADNFIWGSFTVELVGEDGLLTSVADEMPFPPVAHVALAGDVRVSLGSLVQRARERCLVTLDAVSLSGTEAKWRLNRSQPTLVGRPCYRDDDQRIGDVIVYRFTVRNSSVVDLGQLMMAVVLPDDGLLLAARYGMPGHNDVVEDAVREVEWTELGRHVELEGFELPLLPPEGEVIVVFDVGIPFGVSREPLARAHQMVAWVVNEAAPAALTTRWEHTETLVTRSPQGPSDLDVFLERLDDPEFVVVEVMLIVLGVMVGSLASGRPKGRWRTLGALGAGILVGVLFAKLLGMVWGEAREMPLLIVLASAAFVYALFAAWGWCRDRIAVGESSEDA